MREKKDDGNPLVSVIIPVYNGSNYIEQAIKSALSQSYHNIEVIVVNDGSNDSGQTEKIALSFGDKIRYLKKTNGGVATALNYGIDNMQGQYFSWLSHDDLYDIDKIKYEMNLIKERGECIVGCDVAIINESGEVKRYNHMSSRKDKSIACFLALDTDTGLNGCSLLIPRKYFEECGKFNSNLKCTQDYDMWYRMAKKFKFNFCTECLVLSREHPEQDSRTKGEICTQEADLLHANILKEISCDELERYNENMLDIERQYKIFYSAGYLKTAAQILLKLIHIYRSRGMEYSYRNMFQKEVVQVEHPHEVDFIVTQIENYKAEKNEKKVIMIYSNVWTHGGIERVIATILPTLTEVYKVILVSGKSDRVDGFDIPESVVHIKLGCKLDQRLPYSLLVLAEILQVNLFIGNPNIIESFLPVYSLMEESGIRTILCNHGNYFLPCWAEYLRPLMKKRQEFYPKASVVTWPNSFNAYLGENLNSNTVLLPNPNSYELQNEILKRDGQKIVLCVGRFYDQIKRIDRTLRVFRKVVDKVPDAKLYLVGGYDLDMLIPEGNITVKDLIDKLNFPDENTLVWYGEQDNVEEFYKEASLLLLTSDSEGFGMVLNEAAVFACPSVIFEIAGLEDIIENGKNGVIIPQGNESQMADAVCDLLENPDKLRHMQSEAQIMASRFNKEVINSKWLQLIEGVLNDDVLNMVTKFDLTTKKKYCDMAVNLYKKEIENIIYVREQHFTKDMSEQFRKEIERVWLKCAGTDMSILEKYEQILIYGIEQKRTDLLKYILSQLPLDKPEKRIGIYGTGVHTNGLLESYKQLIGSIKAHIIFIDSNKTSLTEKYAGRDIYNVHDLSPLKLDAIIISSRLYEEEMYNTLIELYKEAYPIYRFYQKSTERLF